MPKSKKNICRGCLVYPAITTFSISALLVAGCNSPGDSESNPVSQQAPTTPASMEVDHWPHFRGPEFRSTTGGQHFPTTWAMDDGILWKSELPGRGASSPIVQADHIYLTAYDGFGLNLEDPGDYQNLRHHLLCFDRQTGEPVWQREIQGTDLKQTVNPELIKHGFASATPATDGEHVYAWFGVTGVFAFDRDGRELWHRNLGLETNYFGSSASPMLYKDLVIVNASIESQRIYALNRDTGAVVWWIPDVIECWSMPVIGFNQHGEAELVVSSKNVVAGYNPDDGQQRWHCLGVQDYVVSTPVIVNDVCYLSGGKQKQTMAIRLGGSGDVEETHKLWELQKIGGNVSSPVWHEGRLFIFHDNGIVQVIDAETGKLINRHRTATSSRPFASPLLAGDRLFMPFQDAGIAVMQADDQCDEIALNPLPDESPLIASIAASEDRLFFRSDRNLYCVHAQSDGGKTEPTRVIPWAEPPDRQLVATRQSCLVDPEKGWSRRYLLFLSDDMAATIRFLLMPYQSVITDEQNGQAESIIRGEQARYDELRKVFEALEQERLQSAAADVPELQGRYEELEQNTKQLNNEVRIQVKKLFSEEQMEKHLADAKIGKAHLKPEPPQSDGPGQDPDD